MRLIDILGQDTIEEMEAMSETELKSVIVSANQAMKTVEEELEANKDYQELKFKKAAMEAGKKEVNKRQKAKIRFSLNLLESIGKS